MTSSWIVTLSAHCEPGSGTSSWCVKVVFLIAIYMLIMSCNKSINVYCRDELFMHSLECYFGVYFPRCFATREINTKVTLLWAQIQLAPPFAPLFSMYHATWWLTGVSEQSSPLSCGWSSIYRGSWNMCEVVTAHIWICAFSCSVEITPT